jgi:hypothetical protein
MKNIHLMPTDKPSSYVTNYMEQNMQWQNIYITSDEKIKEGDWHFNLALNLVEKTTSFHNGLLCEKIILTTDQDLIKDGVQVIDDGFLVWFVDNPNSKVVKIEKEQVNNKPGSSYSTITNYKYKIIIPQEEPKQEKLEETTEINLTRLCYYDKRNPDFQIKEEYGYDKEEVEATGNFSKKDCACDNCFYGRSKLTEQLIWQKKRMYSEEEVYNLLCSMPNFFNMTIPQQIKARNNWFEQFKKK